MRETIKKHNVKKGILKSIGFIMEQVIAILISVLFCLNANIIFGNLGHTNTQIKLADDARMKNDYSESLIWYEKIAKKNNEYSPYAYLAIAEIYSTELENKEYSKALEAFQNACKNCNDISIYNSCMHFILQQIHLSNNGEKNIDILNSDNVNFVVNTMNKINELSPQSFLIMDIVFPLDSSDVLKFFTEKDKIKLNYRQYMYDSTRIDTKAGLQYVNENEKLVFVEQWQERINPSNPADASVVTYYKYFHYTTKTVNKELSPIDAVYSILTEQNRIYLSQLNFEE